MSADNVIMGLPCGSAAEEPAETPTLSPLERHAYAAAARERLREATEEAFPRSPQYRPAGDGTGHVGSGEA